MIEKDSKYFEYIIQAILIVFSVLLALFLDEYRSNLKTEKDIQQILENIRMELKENKVINTNLIDYHSQILKKIEQVFESDTSINELKSDFGIKLYLLAPKGIMQQATSNSVWEAAKLNGLLSQTDFKKLLLIGKAYNQQQGIANQVQIIAKLWRSRENLVNAKVEENVLLFGREVLELKEREIELNRIYEKVLIEIEED